MGVPKVGSVDPYFIVHSLVQLRSWGRRGIVSEIGMGLVGRIDRAERIEGKDEMGGSKVG